MADAPALALRIDPEALRVLIAAVVAEAVAALEADRARLEGRLAWSEPEAAALLGLNAHQLRDERRRGRIGAAVGPGGKILYSKSDLLAYLAARRYEPAAAGARHRRDSE